MENVMKNAKHSKKGGDELKRKMSEKDRTPKTVQRLGKQK